MAFSIQLWFVAGKNLHPDWRLSMMSGPFIVSQGLLRISPMVVKVLATLLLLLSMGWPNFAAAAKYRFVKIADSTQFSSSQPVGLYAPRLNDNGEVTFYAQDLSNNLNTWMYKGNGGALTQLAASGRGIRYLSNYDFNNAGVAAYQALLNELIELPDGTVMRRHGYFTGDGTTTRTVLLDAPNLNSSTRQLRGYQNGPVINDRGQGMVILTDASKRSVIVDGQGRALATSPDGRTIYYDPSLNNNGVAAFVARRATTAGNARFELLAGSPGGLLRKVVDSATSEILGVHRPQINDAGTIVFLGSLDSGMQGVFLADQSGTRAVFVDTEEVLGLLLNCGINNRGEIAFEASGTDTVIYSGPDLVADRVIGTGDRLLGLRVGNVAFLGDINSAGQIAFSAVLGDGRNAIFRAEPILR